MELGAEFGCGTYGEHVVDVLAFNLEVVTVDVLEEARQLVVGDAGFVEVDHAEVLFGEVVGEEGLEVGGAGGEDDLVAVDRLVLDDQGHVTELLLIEYRDEVLLVVVDEAGTHHVVGIPVVLCARDAFFGDGGEAAAHILLVVIGLVLLIGVVEGVITR